MLNKAAYLQQLTAHYSPRPLIIDGAGKVPLDSYVLRYAADVPALVITTAVAPPDFFTGYFSAWASIYYVSSAYSTN